MDSKNFIEKQVLKILKATNIEEEILHKMFVDEGVDVDFLIQVLKDLHKESKIKVLIKSDSCLFEWDSHKPYVKGVYYITSKM
ncbi:hypothetical protein BJL57_08450 [Campylobacter jejuni]|nr:hypothetical protein [Campylobacter jejuni]